jgi:hypothetical protein
MMELLWVSAVGKKMMASDLNESSLIVLTRRCILHAYSVNRKYFAARLSPTTLASMEQLVSAIEDVSDVQDFPPRQVEEAAWNLRPRPESDEEIVAGWAAIVDAFYGFICYRNERNPESLFWTIAEAYHSVANRACAEFQGVDCNCGFSSSERKVEEKHPLCAAEIAYQVAQFEAVEM